jgi:glycosyltransferase involved in cell wall biosynthesis
VANRILHTEWSSGWGGQEQRIIMECAKLISRGHTVLIACQPGSPLFRKAAERGIPVEPVVIRRSYDLRAIWNISRIIRKHGISIVNTHSGKDSWVGGFAAKLAGVDLLIRTRHIALPLSNSPLNFIHRMADGIITTGEHIRQAMIDRNRIRPERIVSIPTGICLDRFTPDVDGSRVRDELGLSAQDMVVTMVAVIRRLKRHDVFIAAAQLLGERFPNVKYLVVGDGPGLEKTRKISEDSRVGDRVVFTGHRDDIPEILAASDIFVLTSEKEGVPQSIAEAMAMEKAVVASPIGGIPELIRDGETGLLADSCNPESFAAAIARLLEDMPLRRRLGEAARRHVLAGFTDETMAARTLDFYDRLLRRKSG